jgi:isoprenylcysteine carboxyl methyltransferase (ICMT) family protein YpbQ
MNTIITTIFFITVIGFALFFHAWITLTAGLLIYLIPLGNRIKEEEKVMKSTFTDY